MFDSNDFLVRLQNGETAEQIAASITEALNKAETAYKAELEADRLAKEAEVAKRANLQSHAQKVADAMNAMFEDCWPEYADAKIKAEDIIDISEMVIGLGSMFQKAKTRAPVRKVKVIKSNADEAIADFLNSVGLL